MSSAKSSSTDSQILWSHIDSLLHPIESSSSSHSQPSPAVQQLDLTGDYKADRKLSVDALERGVDTKTIARAWFQHHAWRPAYSTIMGWKNNDNLLICGSRKGGRARLIGPSEFLEFADKLKSCMPDVSARIFASPLLHGMIWCKFNDLFMFVFRESSLKKANFMNLQLRPYWPPIVSVIKPLLFLLSS